VTKPQVVLLRGHGVTPWELRPWQLLQDRFDVSVLVTERNRFDLEDMHLPLRHTRSRRGLLPRGRVGDLGVLAVGDRYVGLEQHLRDADVVHALELGVPWSGQPASLKAQLGFKLVLTVWETIPLLDAYRYRRGRGYRQAALAAADLFLATTERARAALLLEGVSAERIQVAPPGIDAERFGGAGGPRDTIVSVGRLVWEKGHQDVLRALAAIRHGVVPGEAPPLLIVGDGPERERLQRHADELGVGDLVTFASVPYDEMPALLSRARMLVLASLTTPVWEEQFGMVLAEAMAAGVPVVAADSGAIPEVVGTDGTLFRAGDWIGLARTLVAPAPRLASADRVSSYSIEAAAERLNAAYDHVLTS
jgi:glycosyltransferase involved in cell wall biosynthesis